MSGHPRSTAVPNTGTSAPSSGTSALQNQAIAMSCEYYSKVSTWEEAQYLDMEKGKEEVLPEVQDALDSVHPEIIKRYLGVGPLSINLVQGLRILDLGTGYGRDVFAYSKLVGEIGLVVGIDVSTVELDFARSLIGWHTDKYGYKKPNVEFHKASMTRLDEADIRDDSFDIIISNGSACMVPDIEAFYDEVYRTLKLGGEMHYYNVYADRRIPAEVAQDIYSDPELTGHGLACSYWKDQVDGLRERGMSTPRIVDVVKAWAKGEKALQILGNTRYIYVSYRCFKLAAEVDRSKLYRATYKGTILNCQQQLRFDYFTTFKTNVPKVVDGELSAILQSTRYAAHFCIDVADGACALETTDPLVDPFTLL